MSLAELLRAFPTIEITAPLHSTKKHLHAYRSTLSLTEDDEFLPPFYLCALTGGLQLVLVTHPQFPIRMLGAVNTSDDITIRTPVQTRWLLDGELAAKVSCGESRQARRGVEFDIITHVYRKQEIVWSMTFRALQFMKTEATVPRQTQPAPHEKQNTDPTCTFALPRNAGLTYAKLGYDFNPIHLHDVGAKLFGFPKCMAHGIWVVANANAKHKLVDNKTPQKISFSFKKPTFLPAQVNLYVNENSFTIERVSKERTTVIEGTVNIVAEKM